MPSSDPGPGSTSTTSRSGTPLGPGAGDRGFRVDRGCVTLGPDLLRAVGHLDAHFLALAAEVGAEAYRFPTLIPVAALERLDYFRNFPHLGVLASRLHADRLEGYAGGATVDGAFEPAATDGSDHLLQPAACYHAYLTNEGERFDGSRFITTMGQCFRNEHDYTGLTRLWGFHLREIICIGTADEAKAHLERSKDNIMALADRLDIELVVERASDPFFDTSSERLLMQQLFPSKEEFVSSDGVAIASVNYHRNFFGERCDIRDLDDAPVFTSCVGFGMERWLHVMLDRHDGDPEKVALACQALDPAQGPVR